MKRFLFLLIVAPLLLLPLVPVHAAVSYNTILNTVGDEAGVSTSGVPTTPLLEIIGTIISTALGLLGIVLLLITIYAGFLWMTSQGNEEQVTKAKNMIRDAVIGLLITLAAYSITSFVVTDISTTTKGGLDSYGSK